MNDWMPLGADDVLTVDHNKFGFMLSPTFKAGELLEKADTVLIHRSSYPGLTTDGHVCKLLKPGENWQNAKVRVKVELTIEYVTEQ